LTISSSSPPSRPSVGVSDVSNMPWRLGRCRPNPVKGVGATGTISTMSTFATVSDLGRVRTVTMSNQGRMNAAPPAGWGELADAFEAFEQSDQRVLVITGRDGEFCAGADMARATSDVPSAAEPPSGCVFHTRCPRKIGAVCETDEPPLVEVEIDHAMRCHIPLEELRRLQARAPEGVS